MVVWRFIVSIMIITFLPDPQEKVTRLREIALPFDANWDKKKPESNK